MLVTERCKFNKTGVSIFIKSLISNWLRGLILSLHILLFKFVTDRRNPWQIIYLKIP
jgi:hypothetical protein